MVNPKNNNSICFRDNKQTKKESNLKLPSLSLSNTRRMVSLSRTRVRCGETNSKGKKRRKERERKKGSAKADAHVTVHVSESVRASKVGAFAELATVDLICMNLLFYLKI